MGGSTIIVNSGLLCCRVQGQKKKGLKSPFDLLFSEFALSLEEL